MNSLKKTKIVAWLSAALLAILMVGFLLFCYLKWWAPMQPSVLPPAPEETTTDAEATGSVSGWDKVTEPLRPESTTVKPYQPIAILEHCIQVNSIQDIDGVPYVLFENISNKDIELAIVTCKFAGKIASFQITGLLAGKQMLMSPKEEGSYNLKKEPKSWKMSEKIEYPTKRETHQDVLEISGKDGALTVKNISEKDISSPIYVYYKQVRGGVYIGGATYRVVLKDGLAAGESAQLLAKHFHPDEYKIIFVDYESETI